jgi:hypothetical protein
LAGNSIDESFEHNQMVGLPQFDDDPIDIPVEVDKGHCGLVGAGFNEMGYDRFGITNLNPEIDLDGGGRSLSTRSRCVSENSPNRYGDGQQRPPYQRGRKTLPHPGNEATPSRGFFAPL